MKYKLLFILALYQLTLNAQTITGYITDETDNPLPFANVVLCNNTDSAFITGGRSNDDGYFSIATDRETGILKVSHVGYQLLYISAHQGHIGKLRMQPDKALKEIIVSGSATIHKGDKDVVWITRDMRRGSHNTGEMLGRVPGIIYSRMSKSLSYYGEENIMLLVDSVEKSPEYIKRLHHARFDCIDIIPFPKGKYEGYAAVINLHTKPNYEGYEGAVGGEAEFFPTNRDIDDDMFGNGKWNESFTYTRNKWNFMLNYDGSFEQQARENYSTIDYPMNDYAETVIANADTRKNHKDYDRKHVVTGGVDYQIDQRNSLSVAYRLGLEAADRYDYKTIQQTHHANTTDTIRSNQHGDDNGYAHTIAAYYRGGTGQWNYTADLNVVLNGWDARNLLQKTSGYQNEDNRHNSMRHTLARAEVNRRFLQNKLYAAVGYNNFWKSYKQTRLETQATLTDYTLRQNKLWLYSSYSISPATSINGSAALILNNTRSMGQRDNYLSYDASLGLYQKAGKEGWLRANYKCGVSNPNINQVTAYGQFTDSLLWVGGNPMLRSSITHDFDLRYHFCKWLTVQAKYRLQPCTFASITELREGPLENGTTGHYAATTTQNVHYQNLWLGLYYEQHMGSLTLSADIDYRYAQGRYSEYRNAVGYWFGNCMAEYYWEKPDLYVSCAYNLSIDYDAWAQGKQKNQADMFWFYVEKSFFKERLSLTFSYVLPLHLTSGDNYRSVTTPATVAYYKDYSLNRLSNHNFEIGLTYRFSGGKSVRKYQREMSEEK